jgi:hypothetical protein
MERQLGIMKGDAENLDSANERKSLLGVKVSAGSLVALGCYWGFYALFFVVIMGIAGVRAWKNRAFMAPDIAEIDANRNLNLGLPA